VSGVQNRNRALEGDLVAIELNNESEWKVLNDLIIEQVPALVVHLNQA